MQLALITMPEVQFALPVGMSSLSINPKLHKTRIYKSHDGINGTDSNLFFFVLLHFVTIKELVYILSEKSHFIYGNYKRSFEITYNLCIVIVVQTLILNNDLNLRKGSSVAKST